MGAGVAAPETLGRLGAEIDKFASARSISAATTPATRTALIGEQSETSTRFDPPNFHWLVICPGSDHRSDGAHSPASAELIGLPR
jgi:hypothetical protein